MSSLLLQKVQQEALRPSTRTDESDRQLLISSKQFAIESRLVSWWHLLTTLAVLSLFVYASIVTSSLLIKFGCSLLIGLTLVRMFILYHDYLHHSIFKGSRLAGGILTLYGHLMLTAPMVWKRSHDHHHRNNSKMFGASIGSFPIMTKANYEVASRLERWEYRMARSPWVIVLGYFTVFLFGMCIYPLIRDFKRNASALVTLAIHFGWIAISVHYFGWQVTIFSFLIPTWIAMMSGAYLFYVQHNFPDAKIRECQDWTYTDAALESSSYLETGPIMQWFTGNIGYHHIHHLNGKIPFYKLPQAMKALKEVQCPGRTSLKIADIRKCLRLKLWDTELDEFITFRALSPLKLPNA